MVSVDDPFFLINHVRRCFATGDDSGFWEFLLKSYSTTEPSDSDCLEDDEFSLPIVDTESADFADQSPECPFYVESGDVFEFLREPYHAKTVQRENANKITPVKPLRDLSETEIDHYFPIHTPPTNVCDSPNPRATGVRKSALTVALEQAKADGRLSRSRLFADYAVHDGRGVGNEYATGDSQSIGLRLFVVWFWRISDFPRFSLRVHPRLGTTVRQFIGLAFRQYFNENNTIITNEETTNLGRFDESFIDRLSVYAMESPEDGVDCELPPLVMTDPIHKYEFAAFALVEQTDSRVGEVKAEDEIPLVLVHIHLAQGISIYRFRANAQLSTVLDHVVRCRLLPKHGAYAYHLESMPPSNPPSSNLTDSSSSPASIKRGKRLHLDMRLSDCMAANIPLQFVLARDNSRCDPVLMESSEGDSDEAPFRGEPALDNKRVHDARKLRQHAVCMLKGSFPKDVLLAISADGIKIEPLNVSRRRKLFSKSIKPIVYTVDELADCELSMLTPAVSASASSSTTTITTRSGCATAAVTSPSSASSSTNSAYHAGKVQLSITYLPHFESSEDSAGSGTAVEATCSKSRSSAASRSSPQFQQLLFETQWSRAHAIRDQLQLILDSSKSRAHRLYVQTRLEAIS